MFTYGRHAIHPALCSPPARKTERQKEETHIFYQRPTMHPLQRFRLKQDLRKQSESARKRNQKTRNREKDKNKRPPTTNQSKKTNRQPGGDDCSHWGLGGSGCVNRTRESPQKHPTRNQNPRNKVSRQRQFEQARGIEQVCL